LYDKFINIDTRTVTSIDASLPTDLDFVTYSNTFLRNNLNNYFSYILTNIFLVPAQLTQVTAPMFRDAIMAHYAGDEKMGSSERKQLDELKLIAPPFITDALSGMWTDLGVKDNKTHIKIK